MKTYWIRFDAVLMGMVDEQEALATVSYDLIQKIKEGDYSCFTIEEVTEEQLRNRIVEDEDNVH